jgi:phosphatidylserine/phosphatidylglycerophosphate/cardiolipin synthase-like enzyme
MKPLWRLAQALPFIALVVAGLAAADAPAIQRYPATGSIEIAFTPDDRIDRLIVAAIDAARHEVLVQAYSFTDHSIARALVRARKRGAEVRVVADREQARSLPQNVLPELVAGGVEVWLDGNFQAAHNKVIIIDADASHATTITGSYNFTIAAQRGNAENVIVLRDNAPVARGYRDNWLRRQANAAAWSDDALR